VTAEDVVLAGRVVGLAIDALARLVRAGHPDPEQALAAALDGIELAAQERAQKQYGGG